MARIRFLTPLKRQWLLAVTASLPATLIALILLWAGDYDRLYWVTITIILVTSTLTFPTMIYLASKNRWQIVSNILASFREGDFSLKAHESRHSDSLSEAMREINLLADTLTEQRLNAVERQALLIKILREVDIAIFCIDANNQVTLANHFGARLFESTPEKIIGQDVEAIGLQEAMLAVSHTAVEMSFPLRQSRWLVKQGHYREQGQPQRLIILADLGQTLREEELGAWKRLIRVLAHELNNSMTPVKSVTQTLSKIIDRDPLPDDWQSDVKDGLTVIHNRIENLSRFVADYSKIARIPTPDTKPNKLSPIISRIAKLDPRKEVHVTEGPDCSALIDEPQIEQTLINLTKNAIDATEETGGNVSITWATGGRFAQIEITDEGPGLANTDNLFIPYFTTKAKGSGIGLFLSRQIVEAHGGSLNLENRKKQTGCIATVRLPLA